MHIEMQPIGFVDVSRSPAADDRWGDARSCISLSDGFSPEALQGLADFSHVEVIFHFHDADPATIVVGTRHPRDNPAWPKIGIFAQRGRNRPNRIGATICRVLGVDGAKLFVSELDAIDGTPVLDIKPVMAEFLPREAVSQPQWSREVMRDYWLSTE